MTTTPVTTAPGQEQPILIRFATPVTTRRLSVVAAVLWLGVTASTAAWWDTRENWQPWYGLYCLLLGSAAALTAASAISATWRGSTEQMETPGVGFTVFAVCTTIIAWALPVWAVAIAFGYVVFAIEARGHRRGLAMLALAQLAGLAVTLVGEAAELGPTNDSGDHPYVLSAAIATTTLLTALALVLLNRRRRSRHIS